MSDTQDCDNYDSDDFEDVSDDEGSRNLQKSASLSRTAPLAPSPAPRPVASAVQQPSPRDVPAVSHRSVPRADAPRPGRRRPEESENRPPRPEDAAVDMVSAIEGTGEMLTSNGSGFSTGGRRPVRGRVSVDPSSEADRRPGTNDSNGPKPASRPLWLQHDEKVSLARDMVRPAVVRSNSRPRVASDLANDESDALGGADESRKVKRLQQEIQRLTQRLTEAELYSKQDEGLPLFTLDEVEVGTQIAQGGFASVHHAWWRGTQCALKKIFDPIITEELRSEFENEVRMLRRIRHPNIVTIMAVCRKPPALSILTEYVGGGSLFEIIHSPPQAKPHGCIACEPSNLLPVLLQAAAALAYLHAMHVVHRDVKSPNVLLTEGKHPVAKLCDFGLAKPNSELCTGTMQWAGTAAYMAPELFAKRKYTEAVDIFAFGVMLWEAMSAEIPHANMDPSDIAHRVQTKDYAGLGVAHSWSKSVKALLKVALAAQAEQRPAMVAVAERLRGIVPEYRGTD